MGSSGKLFPRLANARDLRSSLVVSEQELRLPRLLFTLSHELPFVALADALAPFSFLGLSIADLRRFGL